MASKTIRARSAPTGKETAPLPPDELRLTLRELRGLLGFTQADVAARLGVTQSQLSAWENGKDHKVSSVRRYVEAIAAPLEVSTVVGGVRIILEEL